MKGQGLNDIAVPQQNGSYCAVHLGVAQFADRFVGRFDWGMSGGGYQVSARMHGVLWGFSYVAAQEGRGILAMTLGHTIIGQDQQGLESGSRP